MSGTEITEIISGVVFKAIDGEDGPSTNYSTFKNGIAFLKNFESSEMVQLLTVSENGLDTLGELSGTSRWTKFYGLGQIKDGLIFLMSDSFSDELDGAYVYNEGNSTITKIAIDGHTTRVPAIIECNDDFQIAVLPRKGLYSVSSDTSAAQHIFEIELNFPIQDHSIEHFIN